MAGNESADAELMRPSEVAAVFGVTARTASRWGRQGVLRTLRTPGNHMRFYADEVRALASKRGDLGTQRDVVDTDEPRKDRFSAPTAE